EGTMKRKKPDFNPFESFEGSCEFYYNGWKQKGAPGNIDRASVRRNQDWINEIKILIPKAWGTGNQSRDKLDPFIVAPNSSCTETYLVIGPFESEEIANNVISYINTKFFHFFTAFVKNTQNTMKGAYLHVPIQDFNEEWSDEKLYQKYELTRGEINLIDSLIWP
ncbi:MAG: restriction endonuclease, partial [Candidatus Thermoplasmatota archaeon]|nr:restriction endonuclease [Candidatus Thermoplasmatota archaeon]